MIGRTLVALVTSLTVGASAALAITRPFQGSEAGAVRHPGLVSLSTDPAHQRALTGTQAWQDFQARHGTWQVLWNPQTRTPHRAFGAGIALSGFANEPGAIDRSVRRFVAEQPDLMGGSGIELQRAHIGRARDVWYARYRQVVRSVPVLFSDWEFRIGTNGLLFAFGADAHRVPEDVATTPRIVAAVAREAAKAGLAFDPASDRAEGGEGLGLLPLATEDGFDYRLVYDVRVSTANPPGNWLTYVDAANGEVLWRHNRVRHAITGAVNGEVHLDLPTGALVPSPFRHQVVRTTTTSVFSDGAGNYSVTGPAATTLSAELAGRWCNVNRQDGTDAAFSTPATDPSTVGINWAPGNSQDSERDGYYHTTLAHDHAKTLDPGFTGNDYAMPCAVNISNTCNAFWDGTGINFYLAGGGCPNTATMPDVVYHEYGHGVNDNLYIQAGSALGMFNGALHEGMADVFAAFIQDSPDGGKGFFGPGTVLRSLDNTARWPDDASGDTHITGLIIGGAFWDLRQAVGLALAESLSHFAKYGVPDDSNDGLAMTEYFIETLVADDDDANLANGTPHLAAINTAFNAHGIGTAFFLDIAHTPLADQPAGGSYAVTATIQYTGPSFSSLDASSPTVFYSINNGPFTSAPLTPTGTPNEFSGNIASPSGKIVRYYLQAADAFGGTLTEPADAASGQVHLFLTGTPSVLLLHDQEADHGWTVGAPDDDATTGIWIRTNPNGTDGGAGLVQPEDDHTVTPGILCFVTGNAIPGAGIGVNDVDGGKTTLTSAPFDALTAAPIPLVEYYRWYTNNAGASPGLDVWRTQISNDGGGSWVDVEVTPVTAASWTRVLFFISDYVTPTANMRMRFIAADEGDGSLVEAALDDFRLLAFSSSVAVGDAEIPASVALAPAPNPFRAGTRIRFTLAAPAEVSLGLYDVGGRLVRQLARATYAAGEHAVAWDGRDAHGHPVASGTYFARLGLGDREISRTVVKMR